MAKYGDCTLPKFCCEYGTCSVPTALKRHKKPKGQLTTTVPVSYLKGYNL